MDTKYDDENDNVTELNGEILPTLNLDEKLEQNFVQDGHDVTIYDDHNIQKPSTNKGDSNSDSKYNSKINTTDEDDGDDLEMALMIPQQTCLPHTNVTNKNIEYVYMKKVMRVMENNDKNYILPLEQEESQTEIIAPLFSTYNHDDTKLSSFTVGIRSKVQTQSKRGFIQKWCYWYSRAFLIDKTKYMRFCTIYNYGIIEYGTILCTHPSTVMAMTYQPSISNFKYQLGCNLFQKAYHKVQLFSNLSSKNGCTQIGMKHKYNQSNGSEPTTTTSLEYNLHNCTSRPFTIHRTASRTETLFSMGGDLSSFSKFWQLQFWWKDPSLSKRKLERGLISHSIGVLWDNVLGLAWTWRLQYGSNAIIDIPVYLSPTGGSSHFVNNVYFASFLNAFSFLLQRGISTVLLPKLLAHTATAQDKEEQYWQDNNTGLVTEKKVKQHELQSKLMERKATISRKRELDKNGLIILSAIYGYDNNTSYDVTIALQFWIKDSRLELPSGSSKRHLLGFPDLSTKRRGLPHTKATSLEKNTSGTKHSSSKTRNSSSSYLDKILGLIDSFIFTFYSSQDMTTVDKETLQAPQLIIRYKYEDLTYQIGIEDNEGIILPSTHAVLLSPDDRSKPVKI